MGQRVSTMRCYVPNGPKTAVYTWQRRCLFTLLLSLILLIFFNFAVTLWLIKVLDINLSGIEGLNILSEGLELQGHTFVLGSLISSNILSSQDHSVLVESPHNFTIDTRDHFGRITNSLFIDENKIQSHSSVFSVSDSRGRSIFSVDRHEVVVGAETLRLSGLGGNVFDGSVKTSKVESGIGTDLRLETSNTKLHINAASGIRMESIAGDIRASSQEDIKLESIDGGIRLDASDVYLPGLKTAHSFQHRKHRSSSRIYQLCACNNGKLFLAPADGRCATSSESSTCR